MMRKLQEFSSFMSSALAAGIFAAALLAIVGEGTAFAQPHFGDKSQLVVTGENLFGLSTEVSGANTATGEQNDYRTRFGFLYSNDSGSTVQTPHGPWVGAHFFIIPNLSIGATIGFEAVSDSQKNRNGNVTRESDTQDRTSFVFLPKVGYALMFGNTIGFWFRGGPGFARVGYTFPNNNNNANSTKASYSAFLLSLDALFVVSPVPHFAFYVGPQADLSLTGSASTTFTNGGIVNTTSSDAWYRRFGVGLGLIGYFDL